MANVTITCPHCGYSREHDETKIPASVTVANCPKCRQQFQLQAAISPIVPPEPDIWGGETFPPVDEPVVSELDMPEPDMPAWEPVAPAPPPQPEVAAAWESPQPPPEPPQPPVAPRQPPQPQSPLQPLRPRRLKFSFTGTARDYFGIWIVNTLLKIVTLGFYTAWAKVRKRRYFYGNTRLSNTVFEYLADPLALFKGWLIAAVFFILYSVGTRVSPVLSGVTGLVFFLGMPWLIVRSRMFNLRNSAHRNIRFTFQPNYREAYVIFAGLPFLIPFTLGLIAPYMVYRQKKFFVENSGYGRTRYNFDARVKDFYLVFLKAAGWFIVMFVALGFTASFVSGALRDFLTLFGDGAVGGKMGKKEMIVSMVLMFALMNCIYLFFAVYVQTSLANLTWNSTCLKRSRFVSTLKVGQMAWLYLSSGLAILLSVGLLIPWASIRIARYRFANLGLDLQDDPDGFLGWGHTEIGSAGEEIGDMFGIDIGL